MSLYPITMLDPATAEIDPNIVNSGSMVIIPIDMTTVLMTELMVFQMSNTQDFSLRSWLSKKPDGVAIIPTIDAVSNGIYPIMRYASGFPIVLYVDGQTPPDSTFCILVAPGIYNLNILNLTNEINLFGFTKTDLA